MAESDTNPPAHDEIHAIPPEDATSKKGAGSQPSVPLSPEVPPSPPHDRERCHCRPDQTPLWKQTLEYIAAVCGIALVLITLYYARAAYRQAVASETAAKAAGDAAEVAKQSLAETARSNKVQEGLNEKTLQTSIDNFTQEQRPYLAETPKWTAQPFIRPTDGAKDGSVQIVWNWSMTNFGKTPASKVTFIEEMKLAGEKWVKNAKNTSLVSHGAAMPPTDEAFDTIFSRPMTQAEANRLLSMEEGVMVRIRIGYEDLLEKNAFDSGICYRHPAAGAVAYCKDGNYIH